MKSLKLSITLIGIFLTTICLAQDPLIDNELNKKDVQVTIENKSAKDASLHANQNSEFSHPVFISDEHEQERQDKLIAEIKELDKKIEDAKKSPSKYPSAELLKQICSDYESLPNYPEIEIQLMIDHGQLTKQLLDDNNIDINSKLYKKVVDSKELNK